MVLVRGRKEEGCDAAALVYDTPKMADEVIMIDLALLTLFNMFGATLRASRLTKSCTRTATSSVQTCDDDRGITRIKSGSNNAKKLC